MAPYFEGLRPNIVISSYVRRRILPICAILFVSTILAMPAQGAQVLLEPMTTGSYSWDWIGNPVNQSWGFDELAPIQAGAHQKGTYTRNYRSFMMFDTLASDSAILSATLDLTVTRRMTDTLTNPLSRLEITLGLPRQFTAQEIADPVFTATPPNAANVYNDLATNGFATFAIPFGDVIEPIQNDPVQLNVPLPLAFVAAFNQTRVSSRYLTVSLFGGDYGMFSADLSVRPQLFVTNLTPVPEPIGWACLAIGAGIIFARKRILARRA